MMKPVRAWAWVQKNGNLCEYGNGNEYQYPIFSSSRDARKWRRETCGSPNDVAQLIRVYIRVESKKP